MGRSFDRDELRFSRRVAVAMILIGGLVLGRGALPGWLGWWTATTGWLHDPLQELLCSKSEAIETMLSPEEAFASVEAYLEGALPKNHSGRFWPVSVMDSNQEEGFLRVALMGAKPKLGSLVVCRSTLVGFIVSIDGDSAEIATAHRKSTRMPIQVILENQSCVDAVGASVLPRQSADVMSLLRPSRIEGLREGLSVVTASRSIVWHEGISDVELPAGLLVGRLVPKTNASLGDRVPFVVELRTEAFSEDRVCIEMTGGEHEPQRPRFGTGFIQSKAVCLRSPSWNGAGLDFGFSGDPEIGQAVTIENTLVGIVDRVGYKRSQARRIEDGGIEIIAIGHGAGMAVRAPLVFLGGDLFRLRGNGPGLLPGDWLVTAPQDNVIPAGLLIGRVLEFQDDRIGRLAKSKASRGSSLTVWHREPSQ